MEARAARIGEHVEDDELLAALGDALGLGPRPCGVGRVERALLLPPVLPGDFDVPGHGGRVAERRLVGLLAHVFSLITSWVVACRGAADKKKPLAQEGSRVDAGMLPALVNAAAEGAADQPCAQG